MSKKRCRDTIRPTGTTAAEQAIAAGKPTRPTYVLLWFAALCIVMFCVYAPALHGQFILDDVPKIQNNPDLRDWDHLGALLIHRYPPSRTIDEKFQANMHNDPSRPLVYYSFALNYHWGQLNPFGYHLVNIILHCLNTLLLWLFTCQIWLLIFKKRSALFPCLIATLFALHPVNTGVVSYIFSRSDLLATFFFLAALLLASYSFSAQRWRIGAYALSLVCFVLSLLSKQSSATFPLVVLLYDYLLLSDFSLAGVRQRKFFHLGLWIVLCGYLLARFLYFGQMGDLEAAETWPMYNYTITQPFSIVKYLQLILVPIGLCLDHGIAAARSVFEPKILTSLLLIVGIIAAVRFAYQRRTPADKLVVFSALWFFLALAPTSTVLPTTAVLVENRIYLAGVAWAGLLGLLYWLGWQATSKAPLWRKAVIAVCVLHIAILCGVTLGHNDVFRTREKMWLAADQLYPRQSRTQQGLGDVYLYDKQDYDKATYHYEELVDIDQHLGRPVPVNIYHNLGSMYFWKGDRARAEEDYKKELARYPDSLATHKDLAFTYCVLNRLPEAEKEYRECLRLDPNCERAYYVIGVCCQNTGRIAEAIADYRHALALDPTDENVRKDMAMLAASLQKANNGGKK